MLNRQGVQQVSSTLDVLCFDHEITMFDIDLLTACARRINDIAAEASRELCDKLAKKDGNK